MVLLHLACRGVNTSMVSSRRYLNNIIITPLFFAYGLKMRTSTCPTSEINSSYATSTPLVISAIFLFSRTRAIAMTCNSNVENISVWQGNEAIATTTQFRLCIFILLALSIGLIENQRLSVQLKNWLQHGPHYKFPT